MLYYIHIQLQEKSLDKLKLHILQSTVEAMPTAEQTRYYRRVMVHAFAQKAKEKAKAFAKSKVGTALIAVTVAIVMILGQAHQRAKMDAHDAKYGTGITFK